MCRSRGAIFCKHCRVQASCSSSCSGRVRVARAAGAALCGLPRDERGAAFAGPALGGHGARREGDTSESGCCSSSVRAWQAGS